MSVLPANGKIFLHLCTCLLAYHVLLFQVEIVNCQRHDRGGRLPVSMFPFCIELPVALHPGLIFKIMGTFENSTSTRLNIILRSGCLAAESPFHVSIKFDDRQVVRNSFQNGNWGDEESGGIFPFSSGQQFVLLIEIQPDEYKFAGNGVQLWTFAHRLPYADVKTLQVTLSSTSIRKIFLIDRANKNQPEKTELIYPVPMEKPIIRPSFPFWGNFPQGLQAGKAISIQGYFPSQISRANFNLCTDTDCAEGPIVLHLDIRFRFHSDVGSVIRNVKVDGRWADAAREERDGPFPFRIREAFTMVIQVQPDGYNIEVNDVHCWTFQHRLPFAEVTTLTIEDGPLNIWKIEYIDIPKQGEGFTDVSYPDVRISSGGSRIYDNSVFIFLFVSSVLFPQLM